MLTADQVDKTQLDAFLSQHYPLAKSQFLSEYGMWWHGSDQNRWVLLADEKIIGYSAVIPTRISLQGSETPAVWWVDLVIDPHYRGQGLQSLFDEQVRQLAEIKLGFPNELAAKIHRKHGWGVREDLEVLMLPLRPLRVKNVRQATGWRGGMLRLASLVLTPIVTLARQRFLHHRSQTAWKLEDPVPEPFAKAYQAYNSHHLNTTHRDIDHLRWRYFNSPFRSQYRFFLGGSLDSPTHYLISRHLNVHGCPYTRILDLFGNFQDLCGLREILIVAIQDAIQNHSSQVTIMVSMPELRTILRSLGFVISSQARFCWYSSSSATMAVLGNRGYWTLGDSDNDEPS